MIKKERIHDLTPGRKAEGNVVYWMSREQRAEDNPGLQYARNLADKAKSRLSVIFTLTDNYPGATIRHYDFMLKGLK
jgi:deoxyribodipyrimidine photo-lyase